MKAFNECIVVARLLVMDEYTGLKGRVGDEQRNNEAIAFLRLSAGCPKLCIGIDH